MGHLGYQAFEGYFRPLVILVIKLLESFISVTKLSCDSSYNLSLVTELWR